MTEHGQALALAATAVDFPLETASAAALEDHLRTCAACRSEAQGYLRDARWLAELRPLAPPARTRTALLAQRRSRPMGLLAAAALLTGLTLGGLTLAGAVVNELSLAPSPAPLPTPPLLASPSPAPSPPPSGEVSSPSGTRVGTAWRLVDDPDLLPGRLDGTAGGVIPGGPGAIAWGFVYGEPPLIWTSPDGIAWSRAAVETTRDGTALFEASVADVASFAGGYVAVGNYHITDAGTTRAVAWTSVDGTAWSVVPDDPVFSDSGFHQVVPWGGGLLAFGSESLGYHGGGPLVWTSTDGITWTRLALSLPPGVTGVGGVVPGPDRLWGGARDDSSSDDPLGTDGPTRIPEILTSTDGRTWTATGLAHLGPLVVIDGDLHAIAQPWPLPEPDLTPPPRPPEALAEGVYRAVEGRWEPVVQEPMTTRNDLVAVGSTWVMVGDTYPETVPCEPGCRPRASRSEDAGRTWEVVPVDDKGGGMLAVAALPDGTLVAVGYGHGDGARRTVAAWVSVPIAVACLDIPEEQCNEVLAALQDRVPPGDDLTSAIIYLQRCSGDGPCDEVPPGTWVGRGWAEFAGAREPWNFEVSLPAAGDWTVIPTAGEWRSPRSSALAGGQTTLPSGACWGVIDVDGSFWNPVGVLSQAVLDQLTTVAFVPVSSDRAALWSDDEPVIHLVRHRWDRKFVSPEC
jgi:hypothetical protein